MAQYSVNRRQHYGVNNKDLHEVVMLSDQNGNILNSFGSASNIPIASGDVAGYSHINKFGHSGTDVSTATDPATIWDGNGTNNLYQYPPAGLLTVASTDTGNDNGLTVEVQGLDANYNPQIENIVIGTQGSLTFVRTFRARVIDGENAGTVSVFDGGPNISAVIRPGNGQTLMALYTVPAGKTAYLLKISFSLDKSNADARVGLFTREFGAGFNIKGQWGLAAGNGVVYDYPVPLVFPEKTDIECRVIEVGASVGVGAIFDLILVDN